MWYVVAAAAVTHFEGRLLSKEFERALHIENNSASRLKCN
jgi:hypothetical protein